MQALPRLILPLLLLGAALPGLAQSPAPAPADKPVIKVGQVAVYRFEMRHDRKEFEDRQTVTAIDGDLVKIRSVNPQDRTERDAITTTEWNQVLSSTSGIRMEPHAGMLNFPLSVGKSWSSLYQTTVPSGAKLRAEMQVKVESWEKVKVPAGEFDAFRLRGTGWNNGVSFTGSLRMEQTLWYAPSIGRMVRSDYRDWAGSGPLPRVHNVLELQSYTDAP